MARSCSLGPVSTGTKVTSSTNDADEERGSEEAVPQPARASARAPRASILPRCVRRFGAMASNLSKGPLCLAAVGLRRAVLATPAGCHPEVAEVSAFGYDTRPPYS